MSRMLKLAAVSLLALVALNACTSRTVLNDLTTDKGYTLTADVPYDRAHNLTLDVYSPDNVQNAPVVVFFFGGRWQEGDKSQYKFVGQALAAQGFLAVIPNYRLYPQVRFPDFVKDGANAVKWARDNAARYGGSAGKLFVMGHSSGAHIAAMLALDEEFLKGVGGSRSWLRGMIGLAGPYDFMPITAPDLRDIFSPVERFAYSQPIFFVDGQNPPLFLVHGEDDKIIDVANTRKLAQAVSKAGGPVETLIYPKLSHDLAIGSFSSVISNHYDVLQQVADFIRRKSAANASNRPSTIRAAPLTQNPAPADGQVFTDSIEDTPPVPVQ
ncbi:alpha/beta hydrolase [Solimonas terrae]|uniref:Alpha/beta hydrolase n=1 Tax=Solimonas terrae TaxID=1396819 RepID=A0A6M2BUE7_9GAMM|nr:alpha/beta hydrolase [Solimonas terrae]NGY05875.1 alpha/beta hydrolase [Solimonas terrae]